MGLQRTHLTACPLHTLIHYFSEIHFNIILPFTSRSPKCSISLRFSKEIPLHVTSHPYYMPHPSHLELTPSNIVLFEKLIFAQLLKKFPIFYLTRRIINVFTKAHHLNLPLDLIILIISDTDCERRWLSSGL